MSITAIGRASNTSDFYKTLSPFDGIFDNSFISFMLGKKKKRGRKKGPVLPTENAFVNSTIVLCNIISIKTQA